MREEQAFRIGLLGVGAIAQVVHLPILSELPRVRIQAVCDADRPKAAAIADRFGVPRVFDRDEEVFASDEVDGVVICSPSHLHESQSIAALEAGKHVLVEKPLALGPVAAERVVAAAERSETTLMVAMNNRYRPDAQALKPFARGGELGDIFLIKAGWLNRKMRVARPTWRHRRETAGGGALMDLGVQILDLVLWLLDYPRIERVVAQMHPGERMDVEDTAVVQLEREGGGIISLETSWSLAAERDQHYVQLLGTRGAASLSPLSVHKELEQGLVDVTPPLPPGRSNMYTMSYRQQLNHFVEMARGAHHRELPREQVQLMSWIDLAYRSVERRIELDREAEDAPAPR